MAKNNGGFLLGAIVGGVVGAATAIFLTSEKGKKLLEDISQTGNMEQMKTTATEWLEIAKEKTKEVAKFIPTGKNDEQVSPSEPASSEVTSIPISIPIQSKEDNKENIEKLLKEAEAAFNDAEQKLHKPNETE
jgi:gas vesicle protein